MRAMLKRGARPALARAVIRELRGTQLFVQVLGFLVKTGDQDETRGATGRARLPWLWLTARGE
eukprot:10253186-Alexandrium_andersonii.AAC.1